MSRDALHRLVDELPEADLPTAERVLAGLRATADPLLLALEAAPYDDEGEDSDDELEAVAEARAQADRGELIPHEEVRRRWGLD